MGCKNTLFSSTIGALRLQKDCLRLHESNPMQLVLLQII
jgi:hypothetical protein